ncbi:MAG TPA: alpha/beta hydrolase [Gaiellaceae bacterium]|nr:alpha/beta hydrolase [Gaiellaceae bacterium]
MSEIRINGVSLYYEEHGAGEPILCIHGTGSASVLWLDAARELARHGRTIVYDRRGFSRSERPDPLVSDVHQHADDAAALIDALGAAPAIVIGRSQGGEIAVDLALRYPDRVRALALLEGGGMSLSPSFREWHATLHEKVLAAAATDVNTVGETMFRLVVGDTGWEAMPDAVKQVFTDNGPAIAAEERGVMLDVTAEQLGTIDRPTLIVGGRGSLPEFADVTNRMAAAMPAAKVVWVEGDHLIHPAHPAVLAFVDEALAAESSFQKPALADSRIRSMG